jgi:phosphoribosylpyrophosphate synthetase
MLQIPSLKSSVSKNDVFSQRKYSIFAGIGYEKMAEHLQALNPNRFEYFPTSYQKFLDGTDNITLSGFTPVNRIAGTHVLFLASLLSNDAALSQVSVLIVLLQSFIKSMTIVLPFYPVGTMDRVDVEGKVATASTYAMILSSLPSCGKAARLMIYDIHALQERFYFHGSIIPSLHSALPLVLPHVIKHDITAIAFPDDGAAKRFGQFFSGHGFEIIVCGKVRDGKRRIVRVQDGNPSGKKVLIVDDLVQSGSTLYEAGKVLKRMGAIEVFAYVTHGVFPGDSWKRFVDHDEEGEVAFDPTSATNAPEVEATTEPGQCSAPAELEGAAPYVDSIFLSKPALNRTESPCLASRLFKKFWITNSIPQTAYRIPTKDSVFEVIDLLPQIVRDLDFRSG